MTESTTISIPTTAAMNKVNQRCADLEYRMEQMEKRERERLIDDTWLSIPDAAKKLGMSPKTLKREIEGDLRIKHKGATFVLNGNVKMVGKLIRVASSYCKARVREGDSVSMLKVG